MQYYTDVWRRLRQEDEIFIIRKTNVFTVLHHDCMLAEVVLIYVINPLHVMHGISRLETHVPANGPGLRCRVCKHESMWPLVWRG
jgi:hypothetical protein